MLRYLISSTSKTWLCRLPNKRLPLCNNINQCYAHNETNTNEEPVKFSTSRAKSWKAAYSRSGTEEEDDSPWIQPYSIIGSLSAFLIYFCVLREENDIDEMLGSTIYSRVDGLEEVQLRQVLKYNTERGLDTSDIKHRLNELQELRTNKSVQLES